MSNGKKNKQTASGTPQIASGTPQVASGTPQVTSGTPKKKKKKKSDARKTGEWLREKKRRKNQTPEEILEDLD